MKTVNSLNWSSCDVNCYAIFIQNRLTVRAVKYC